MTDLTAPDAPNLLIRPDQVEPFDRGNGVRTVPYVGKWNCEGNHVTTGQTQFQEGTGLPLHSHNVEESVLILEGEAVAEIDGQEFELVAGEATWVPAGVPHRFYNRGTGVMRIYWVYGGRDVTRTITATGETFEHLSEADRGRAERSVTVIETTNPATGESLASYPVMDDGAIQDALTEVTEAARTWASVPVEERASLLVRIADSLETQRSSLAGRITSEMGKPLCEARGEVDKSAITARWYAQNLQRLLEPQQVDVGDAANAWVTREPIGPVLAIMPWNFPLWQVMRFVLPALGAGNTVVLKHSPNVTGSALAIESLLRDAGAPRGLLRALVVDEARVPEVSERLVADPRVAGVTLTGSNRAGAAVGAAAGRAVKPSVLELGGSDAFVVLSDADVDAAADAAVRARFHNCGQSCVCAKRFVVAADIAERFIERFLLGISRLRVGDPTDESVDVGPMARDDLRTQIQRQVDNSVAAGARLVAGGSAIDGDGWFFEPTVLVVDGPGVPAFDEETFGPVAAVVVAQDDGDAARLAGATAYGLGLSVWSASTERAVALAGRVTTGAVFINSVVASDVRVPFGGTKQSGYGRELSAEGMYAFMNQRTYWAAL